MTLIIGTDEAGYGPNLGPLVIAATAWRAPDELAGRDFYELLSGSVSPDANCQSGRLSIADSKRLYKPRGSLAALERAVHAGLTTLNRSSATWRTTFENLHVGPSWRPPAAPWYADYDEAVPLDAPADHIRHGVESLEASMKTTGLALIDVRAVVVFPADFNRRVRRLGSKGALLTEQTLRLVDALLDRCPADDARVHCDKHGGRNRYGAALQHVWPDSWICIQEENRRQSDYALSIRRRDVRFRFAVGGESQLPCALASMTAKYLRELAMRALNAFWRRHVADLRPTAGYPTDAKRFKSDIAAAQRELDIDDEVLWRCR